MSKKMMMAVAFLASSSAFAYVGPGSSWEQIFASDAVVSHGYNLGGITLDNACLSDTEVKSVRPQRVCTELVAVPVQDHEGIAREEYVCKTWGVSPLASPRKYNQTVCSDFSTNDQNYGECLKWDSVEVTIPQTISVEVRNGNYGESSGNVFNKSFTFPTCPAPAPVPVPANQ